MGEASPQEEVMEYASKVKIVRSIILDTEEGDLKFGFAQELAKATGSEVLSFSELNDTQLVAHLNRF